MSQITLGGMLIFGTIGVRQQGPIAKSRNLRRRLPGVPGYRIIRLTSGKIDGRTWVVRGRLFDLTLAALERQIDRANLTVASGDLFDFRSTGGILYHNCELTAFAPVGPFQCVQMRRPLSTLNTFFVVEVSGTVEQAGP